MLRNKPSFTYKGLTLVLDMPSRFDRASLLSGNGGLFFNNECLRPDYNIHQCDVRIKEDKSPLLEGTKCVVLLGEGAMREWLHNTDDKLGAVRGSVFNRNGIPHIATFFPQDAADIKDFEKDHNPLRKVENTEDDYDDDDEEDTGGDKRRHGKTKRKNYAFWIKKDLDKVKYILAHGVPPRPFEPEYIIWPSSDTVINELESHENEEFYHDIETDSSLQLQCFSFSFGWNKPIYCVPYIDHTYSWAYGNLPRIHKAYGMALAKNTSVTFNGHTFDSLHLARKYHLPIGKNNFDVMLAHFRCYPEIERSLGHCTSLWTYEPFHKDEGDEGYNNIAQVKQKLQYCGKDVYTMILIKRAILEFARKYPGMIDSINQTMDTIRPYLITTLQGIRYFEEERKKIMDYNDKLMMQYLRIINLLIGPKTTEQLQKRFHSALPSSNPQCCFYFHESLGYPIVGRGKVRKDGTRGPSLAKKNIFKLRLKQPNPVLDLVIAYRELAKESGSLKFTPLLNENE